MKQRPFASRRILNILPAVLFFCSLLLTGRQAGAADVVYTVPSASFTTIQAALDAADIARSQPSNTLSYEVLVEPGTYPGGIVLKQSIPLRGRQTKTTILSGGSSNALITASGVTGVSVRNFTFRNAPVGIQATGNAIIAIENNVFSVGSTGTAIEISGAPSTKVVNNTFVVNGTAVSRDSANILIDNNVFSNNTTRNIAQNITEETNITFNVFDPVRSEFRGTDFIPSTTYPDPNPIFVDPAGLDLHLMSGSPCISTGNPSYSGVRDRGAYGGPGTDNIPAPVTGVTSAATSTTSVSISWSENLDYRVTGYKVYYRFTTSGTYSFHGNVIGTTSTVISGLTATAEPPLKPVMDPPAPRDRALVLSWTTDTLATNYNIHYSLESAPTLTTTISHVGNVNTYTLTNLTNYERYWISVTPVAQPTLYSVVTSSYDITAAAAVGPGSGFESDYSAPSLAYFGDMVTGPTSTTVLGIPEPTVPFPTLPNTGCFIATAAYGGQDALPVRVLREFRDRRLLTTSAGRSFVAWYYRTSPALAAWLNGHPALKPLVRAALEPVVIAAALLTHVPALLLFAGAAGLLPLLRRTTRRRPS